MHADYVIVGAGSGGSALAYRLARLAHDPEADDATLMPTSRYAMVGIAQGLEHALSALKPLLEKNDG